MRRILINKVFLTHAKKDLRYRSGIFDKMITKKKKKIPPSCKLMGWKLLQMALKYGGILKTSVKGNLT